MALMMFTVNHALYPSYLSAMFDINKSQLSYNLRSSRMNLPVIVTQARTNWWQGWPSGESTCLPPMWPGFDITRRHTWIEFVGSLLYYERFSPGYSGFPLSPKTNI